MWIFQTMHFHLCISTSNVLWHSKMSNYVFPMTRNIHHLYWKMFYGSHTDTTLMFFAHHINMLFYFQAEFGDG